MRRQSDIEQNDIVLCKLITKKYHKFLDKLARNKLICRETCDIF